MDEQYIDELKENALVELKKIIKSSGNGTFSLFKGKKQSGLCIFRESKDRTGAKTLATGKKLKGEFKGDGKLHYGKIETDKKTITFRVMKGNPVAVQKAFKADFNDDSFRRLGKMLKKADIE